MRNRVSCRARAVHSAQEPHWAHPQKPGRFLATLVLARTEDSWYNEAVRAHHKVWYLSQPELDD